MEATFIKGDGWELNVNGSTTGNASGARIIITSPGEEELEYSVKFGFKATNNEAEYKALVNRLKIAHKLGAKKIRVRTNSKLIVDQVLKEYEARKREWQNICGLFGR